MLDGDWDTCVADGHGPGEGRRPRPRRVRRLRRPRRHRRHGRDRQPLRHPGDRARWCSTPPSRQVMEAGLQWIGGRAILNSANLEDGDAPGHPPRPRVLSLAREYGAAVICLLHRRGGPGPRRRVEAAGRPPHPRPRRRALRPRADRPHLRRADASRCPPATRTCAATASTTIEAIRRIKAELPGVPHHPRPVERVVRPQARRPPRPQLGVPARVRAGRPRLRHRPRGHASCRSTASPTSSARSASTSSTTGGADALSTATDYDPLQKLLELFADVKAAVVEKEDRSDWPIEQRLQPAHHRRRPRRPRAPTSTRRWPRASRALDIVNDMLLAGMKVVGELFGSGEMQLPFVLQSAETMKASVAYLEPHMEKVEGGSGKGRIVLATVKGDVHDIGKNLVDIILTNNGYEVHNLGIKVSITEMIEQGARGEGRRHRHERPAREVHADHARQPRGAERPRPVGHPGAARRRRAHPHLRRARPARASTRAGCSTARTPSRACTSWTASARSSAARRGRRSRLGPRARPIDGPRHALEAARPRARSTRAALPARSPEVETDNEIFVPPFIGSQDRQGHPARRHRRVPQRDRAVPQPVAVPAREQRRGPTTTFKERIRPASLREQLAKAKADDLLVPAGRLRLLALPTATATTS